jgi:ATP synthase B/B' CF(0)
MATSAHTTAPSGAKPPFPPFNKDYFASQLVWFAIFFVALYLIIAKLAIPQIGGIMAARSKHVADDLAEANSLKGQSDVALAAYEKALADARWQTRRATSSTQKPRRPARCWRATSTPSWPRPRRPSLRPKRRPWPTSRRLRPTPQLQLSSD